MDPPVCATCAKTQLGVVHLHWSEGAVVYCCRYCGAFNELPEITSLQRATGVAGNRVTMNTQIRTSHQRPTV
jgi:hypothetical protein